MIADFLLLARLPGSLPEIQAFQECDQDGVRLPVLEHHPGFRVVPQRLAVGGYVDRIIAWRELEPVRHVPVAVQIRYPLQGKWITVAVSGDQHALRLASRHVCGQTCPDSISACVWKQATHYSPGSGIAFSLFHLPPARKRRGNILIDQIGCVFIVYRIKVIQAAAGEG